MIARIVVAVVVADAVAFASGAHALELTLDRAVEIATANHRSIQSVQGSVEGDRLSVETAQSAFDLKILPTGTLGRIGSNAITDASGFNSSAGVLLSRRFETGTQVSMGPTFNRFAGDRNTTLALSLEQPLLRGWQRAVNRDPVFRAEFSLASSERALAQARTNVALEAIGAYYAVLRDDDLERFAQAQERRIEQHTQIAQSKERSGLIGPNDLLRARIRLAEARDALNQARVTHLASLNRLRRALEIPLDTPLTLRPPPEPRLDRAGLEEEAAQSRPELVQLRAELAEAMRNADVAQRNVMPEVVLKVSAGQASVDPLLAQFVPTTQRQWSVFLQASSDLDRTAEKNASRQARLRAESSRIALETKLEDVRRQVREQLLQLDDARVRIGLREDQARQAEARLALAEVKFSHDMASNLDVIEAETELQRAEFVLAAARADYAVGIYQLRAATARLLPFA
jgi:outer membrane protein